jgi:predicted amidohydrolase YtcJ
VSADHIISASAVETMGGDLPRAEAVAVQGARILAVGTRAEIARLAGPRTRWSELDGCALLPGFCDTHMHLEKVAGELAMVHLDGAATISDVLEAVRLAADAAPPGEWVQAFGDDNAWHEQQLRERRLPTREELDGASPERPVFLLRSPDTAALNSLAVHELARSLGRSSGGGLDTEAGLLKGREVKLIQGDLPAPGRERRLQLLQSAAQKLMRMGLTSVVDPGLPARFRESWSLYREAKERDLLPLRVELMDRLDYRLAFADELARVRDEEVHPLSGDDRLRAFGVKLILDGEFDNAWLRAGEADAVVGEQRYSAQELDSVIELCAAHGWPLCVHVMGGGAIDFLLDRIGRAVEAGADFAPCQVSLAHVFLPSRENLLACRRLGIALSVHPPLAYVFERDMQDAWGLLAHEANPLATIRRLGVVVAGGSDVLPCEPLRGAQVAVTRRSRHGSVLGAGEAISPRAALELYTTGAAAYRRRSKSGRIAPGFDADLVAWSANPFEVDPEEWLSLRVRLVAIAGHVLVEG